MRYYEHQSRKAVWSQRIALTVLMAFVVTFGLHRFGPVLAPLAARFLKGHEPLAALLVISTPLALKLLTIAVTGAAMALLLGVIALVNIWREGYLGAGRAAAGVLFSSLVLIAPAWALPALARLPRIHEVCTDPQSPPAFGKLAPARGGEANPARFQPETAIEQAKAYPDIQPQRVNHSIEQAFETVREAVQAFQWTVAREQPPEEGRAGIIEAVDRSPIFGFTDDVIIRVSGGAKDARIDIRSSARYGDHDLGRNAERVRTFFTDVRTRIAQIDKNERIEKVMKRREEQARKAAPCAKGKRRGGACGEEQAASGSGRTNSTEPQEEKQQGETPREENLQAAQDSEPARSPSEAPDEPRPTRRRRQSEPSPDLHRFLEQFLR